nr:unnamed protein product [Spirometra erinaceieuropaei]
MEVDSFLSRFKNVRSSSSWSQNLPSTANADLADVRSPITIPHLAGVFSILDDSVQATVDRLLTWLDADVSKLELFSQELHKLEDRWKAYTTDRDAFKSWLCDRSTIGRLLRDPEPASTSAVDTDSAAIESLCRNPRLLKVYLEEIRERGDRLQTLLRTFDNLTAHSPGAVDQVLRQLEHDYYSISTRLELRLRCRDKKWPQNAIAANAIPTRTTTEGDTKTKEASRSYPPIASTDLAKAESPQSSRDDFTAVKTGRRYHSVDRQPTHSALAELTDIRDRTRALENLLNTVKHIKYDAQRAESAAERSWRHSRSERHDPVRPVRCETELPPSQVPVGEQRTEYHRQRHQQQRQERQWDLPVARKSAGNYRRPACTSSLRRGRPFCEVCRLEYQRGDCCICTKTRIRSDLRVSAWSRFPSYPISASSTTPATNAALTNERPVLPPTNNPASDDHQWGAGYRRPYKTFTTRFL